MSTPTCPNEGEIDMLTTVKPSGTWRIGLFQNNATISATTVLADLTDATFGGYTSGGTSPTYGSITTNGSGQATMTATAIDFAFTSGTTNTIYGYYVKNNTTGKLLKVEKFDATFSMAIAGDKITVTDIFLLAGTIT